MEFKGTKGKWYLCDNGTSIKCDLVKGLLASAWTTYDSDIEFRKEGESWLDMRYRTEPIRHEKKIETKANAQIISKAPELLEALKHSLKILEECNPPDYLVETYGNAIMNYQVLIKESTTV